MKDGRVPAAVLLVTLGKFLGSLASVSSYEMWIIKILTWWACGKLNKIMFRKEEASREVSSKY